MAQENKPSGARPRQRPGWDRPAPRTLHDRHTEPESTGKRLRRPYGTGGHGFFYGVEPLRLSGSRPHSDETESSTHLDAEAFRQLELTYEHFLSHSA